MSAWPSGLPAPQLKNYTNTDLYNVIRTDMESGPPRQARRSSHYMTVGTFTLTLTSAQMASFQSAVVASNYGTDWLTGVPLDTGGGNQPHRIRLLKVTRKTVFPQDARYELTVNFETDEHN